MSTDKNKLIPELRFPEFMEYGEWEEKSLDSHCLNLSSGRDKHIPDGNYELYGSTGIIGRVKDASYDGDFILVARVGANAGLLNRAKGKFGVTDNTLVIDLKREEVIDFIFCSLENLRLNKLVFGSGQPLITGGQLKSLNLIIPPKRNEQQKIASCLSSLDEVIAAHSQKLATLKDHKKGLMQNLFPQLSELGLDRLKDDRIKGKEILKSQNPKNHNSDNVPKYRFPEFLEDGDWAEKSIQKLLDEKIIISHLDGNHGALYPRAEEFSKVGVPYITANDFTSGLVDFANCKHLQPQRAKKFKKGIAKDGDILFAHNATVGPVAKLVTDLPFLILSTTATYYRCDNKYLINDFLKFALSSPVFVHQYSRVMSQSTRNQVPITTQRKFNLQLPKPEEQQKIASCLSSLDDLITAQTEKIKQLKLHKKGLMQGLFPRSITN